MDDKNIKTVRKIVAFAEKAMLYCDGVGADDFGTNDMLVEACVFNLIQIGESVRLLDDGFVAQHGDIPWRKMKGLRNRMVHDYVGMNMLLIWDIINDLPVLVRQLNEISENNHRE